MPCMSCKREYHEHPNAMCYNHVHWAGYVEELEKRSYKNYGIIAEQNYQYFDDPDTFVKLELTRDQLITEWSVYMIANMRYDYENEEAYHFNILRDGREVPEEEKNFLRQEATALATKTKAELDRQEKQAAEEKQRKQEEENDKLSRAMYEALKKKYEDVV